MSSTNAFAALSTLTTKKNHLVVSSGKSKPAKTAKKPENKPQQKPAAKQSITAPTSAQPKKIGGPSSLAKVAAASKEHETKEAAYLQAQAEKKARADERKKQRDDERAAQKAAEPGVEKTAEELEKEAAIAEKKKALEAEPLKVSMKEYRKDLEARRFKLETKAARHVDATAFKGMQKLQNHDVDGIVIKSAPATKTAPAKGNKNKPAAPVQPKTTPKTNKEEKVNFMDLAAQHGRGDRRGGRGGRFQQEERPAAEQVVPGEEAFPDLE